MPHVFRSSFLDWAAEQTSTPREAVFAVLTHTIPNSAEATYARSDLERRRHLMDDWHHVTSAHGADPTWNTSYVKKCGGPEAVSGWRIHQPDIFFRPEPGWLGRVEVTAWLTMTLMETY